MPKLPLGPVVLATSALLAAAPAAHAASSAPAPPSVTLSATAIPKALSSKGAKATATITNTGKATLTGLALRAAGAKGVTGTISGARRGVRSLKPLKAGGKVRVSVTLRRTKGGPTAGAYGLRVRRKGEVVASGRIAFGPKAKPVEDTMVGKYYWGSTYTGTTTVYTLLFSSPTLVFTGEAEGSYPVCTAVSEDCKPYTYDPRTKALTIDGKPATRDGTKLEFDDQAYFALGTASPGARWDTVLTTVSSFGLCPGIYCNFFREDLTFLPDGTFIRGAVASGSSPSSDYAVVPADQKGTYEVRADRTLRLAFADGKERVETLGIFPDKDDAYPANPSAGIVLNGDGYFDIRD